MTHLKNILLLLLLLTLNFKTSKAQAPVSAHQTIYIEAGVNQYSFVNNDFAFYNPGGGSFSGMLITSLPDNGKLIYNRTRVTLSDVKRATIFHDRSKFAFIPGNDRIATSFSFKVKDSTNVLCTNTYTISIKYNKPVSRLVRTANNNYIEYEGLPFLLYGIQLRIDDYVGTTPYGDAGKLSKIYQYFEKTKLAGFRDVGIPIRWAWIEPSENQFNFSLIDTFLVNAQKYDIRLQFLWFGSDVCGSSNVPSYLSNDNVQYPRISTETGVPLNFNNINLINKEIRVVKKLMDYVAANDKNKRVVMIQVENEPDHKGHTAQLWAGDQKAGSMHILDTLGQVIHNGPQDMVTRVNLTGWSTNADDFGTLKGINIVGRDFYADKLKDFTTGSGYFFYPWNYNHTPENGAQYKNIINLALASFDRSSGYFLYELRTTGARIKSYDLGLYRETSDNLWTERDGTQSIAYSLTKTKPDIEGNASELKDFNEMIYKADKKIALSPDSKNVAFNTDDIQGTVIETKSFSSYTVTYSSSVGGEAFALEDEKGDIVLMSLKNNSSFAFQSLPSNLHISIGWFDGKNVWHQNSSRAITSAKVILNAKEVALLTSRDYVNE
jgi:hypothetical protein